MSLSKVPEALIQIFLIPGVDCVKRSNLVKQLYITLMIKNLTLMLLKRLIAPNHSRIKPENRKPTCIPFVMYILPISTLRILITH